MIIYPIPPSELDDKTLSKQIKNIAQVLCQIHYQWIDYKAETLGHAQVIADQIPIYDRSVFDNRRNTYADWGYQCRANYFKLVEMGLKACEEYTWRFSEWHIGLESEIAKEVNHKLQSVIEWARDNVPDLADLDYKHFPVYIPKKYMPILIPVKFVHDQDKTEYIEFRYRYYYRARLSKVIEKGCPCLNCLCMNDKKCKLPTFTRRKTPEWLNDL